MAAEIEAPGRRQAHTSPKPQSQNGPHGLKRTAEDGLESEQRLRKRFDLLNLENGTRLYVPVSGSSDTGLPPFNKPIPLPESPVIIKKIETKPKREHPPSPDDCMEVEDTPNRVYISDLAAELSEVESDEENPIFLSDIEKHLSKIPQHILVGPEPKPTADNQIVLYNVPSSLTVPAEQDNVRKAIVEARARVRERQAHPLPEPERVEINGYNSAMSAVDDDPDAMDLD
ncbi:hypothetical protein GQ43DRAFT_241817 [Delitschia confertaspora ATCC 74209]|uniref:Uncharacterized protein n=1 Tax=Delitschia confertaspora ATCC 74209 TaxID=1513339 RepID=A0A9P4JSR7_9PLEO|nr:hypothetical protein GQ43DRAFT_241817 [Delitschia confertaspora ATCC 74209]